ncbi:DUF5365 family protein [Peribacillus acanthi]|uniref:DUF5365 family protein n=1 Tax=Peribacillus acanthi TaxID=2171554 RepID=UPI000D3E2DED|nr:DUF5365 family protein [Peribacillus acanthi]
MKIVYSSTHEQEEEISTLLSYVYSNILPRYLSDKEIQCYEKMGVLQHPSKSPYYYGTLKEAYQIMTCLQTIISIIERKEVGTNIDDESLEELYVRNTKQLESFGVYIPLVYSQYSSLHTTDKGKEEAFFLFTEPANSMLI